MKLTEQQLHHIFQKEIEWCEKHPDRTLSKEYMQGFIDGLKQAQILVKKIEELKDKYAI